MALNVQPKDFKKTPKTDIIAYDDRDNHSKYETPGYEVSIK
jgi:hypothetical protein